MKVCATCGYRCEDNETECRNCGDAQFLHLCPQCLTEFRDEFCPKCNIRYDTKPHICPNCGEEFFSEACPLCGYLTVKPEELPKDGPAFPGPAKLDPREGMAAKYAEMGIMYTVFGMMACGLPFFTVPGIIYAIKARKLGDQSNSLMIAFTIAALTVVELVLVLYYFWPMITYDL